MFFLEPKLATCIEKKGNRYRCQNSVMGMMGQKHTHKTIKELGEWASNGEANIYPCDKTRDDTLDWLKKNPKSENFKKVKRFQEQFD